MLRFELHPSYVALDQSPKLAMTTPNFHCQEYTDTLLNCSSNSHGTDAEKNAELL